MEALRTRHYSRRTEQAYLHWIGRLSAVPRLRPSAPTRGRRLNRLLTHLAVKENVAASTQNQALARRPLNRIEGAVRVRRPKRLPVVLTREEVGAMLEQLNGVPRLLSTNLYGAGLRLLEGLQLRVKDVDFGRVRDGKGRKDRLTMLPNALHQPLEEHLNQVRTQRETDLKRGSGQAPLPDALVRRLAVGVSGELSLPGR